MSDVDLACLRPCTVLLNSWRVPLVDNAALLRRIQASDDLQVVLDVWEPEPNISRELLDRVALGTPHIAGYSYDGKVTGTAMIYTALCEHLGVKAEASLSELLPQAVDNREKANSADAWRA